MFKIISAKKINFRKPYLILKNIKDFISIQITIYRLKITVFLMYRKISFLIPGIKSRTKKKCL